MKSQFATVSLRALIACGLLLSAVVPVALSYGGRPEIVHPGASPPLPPLREVPPGPAGHERADAGFIGLVLARHSVDLAPRYQGRLSAVHVRLGDRVPENGPIATLDTRTMSFELAIAAADLKAAEIEQEKTAIERSEAGERLDRQKSLSAEGLVSGEGLATARYQEQVANLRTEASKALAREKRSRAGMFQQMAADAVIRAPFEGIVAARYVDPGANVTTQTPIVRLISANDLFVRFAIPADSVAALKTGMPVSIRAGDEGGAVTGSIDKIAPEVDAASRLVVIEARLDPAAASGAGLLSGALVRVSVGEGPQ